MKLIATDLPGAFIVEPTLANDERGFFARTFCAATFAKQGLNPAVAQCSVSFNHRRGTVRGLHYQAAPYEETKLVRCTAGAILDVIVDLRPGSLSWGQWIGINLSQENHYGLFIPAGFAHGFQTLVDNTEVFYQISPEYHPEGARGIRHDDPILAITWPLPISVISERDRTLPGLQP